MRSESETARKCRKQLRTIGMDSDIAYHKAKLILKIYRDVVWSLNNEIKEMQVYAYDLGGRNLEAGLCYLADFAPETDAAEFEMRVCEVMHSKMLIDIVDTLDVIFNDSYPDKYVDSRDYIAGLLIATEAERKGIEKDNATALQQLMLNYVDYESPTRLSKMGVDMLNQYSSKGMDIIRSSISRPTHIEDFLREYFLLFQTGEFE